MLKRRMRKAAAAASPVNASGVADTNVWPSAPVFTNAASKSLRYAGSGSWPVASRTRPDAKNANTSEAAGTATSNQRGCRSRRSILMRIVPSRHQQADLVDARIGPRGLTDDRALVHDRDPVCKRQDLVEVLADQQHGDTFRGCVAEVRVDGLDRSDVEPTGRRGRNEQLRLTRELAREHHLLQVAAGEQACRRRRAGRRDRVAADQLDRTLLDATQPQQRPARRRWTAIRAQDEVRGDAEARRDAGAEPVFRPVRDAGGHRR